MNQNEIARRSFLTATAKIPEMRKQLRDCANPVSASKGRAMRMITFLMNGPVTPPGNH